MSRRAAFISLTACWFLYLAVFTLIVKVALDMNSWRAMLEADGILLVGFTVLTAIAVVVAPPDRGNGG